MDRNHLNNFERGPTKDHSCEVWSKSNQWFRRRCCLKIVDGWTYRQRRRRRMVSDHKSFSFQLRWANNAKSKEGRVVILVRTMSSAPDLHFCQVPSKYSKGYSSYRADKKPISNKTKGDNSKHKEARVVILVHNTSSGHVLHFYKVS